MHILVRHQS